VGKTSIAAKSRQFVQHVVPAVVKPVHTLWHEVIGFLFFVLAVAAVPTSYKAIKKFDGSISSFLTIGMCAVFILIMGGYAISSFLRARKISRS
jgi:NADH:ubiquinone oxidoreductase subunit H